MLSVSPGIYGETLDDSDLQVLPDRTYVVWIHVLHVWVACPREGHSVGSRTTEVISRFFTHYPRLTGVQPAGSGKPRIF